MPQQRTEPPPRLASSGGSRLRAKTITGGGARELAGFHDSLRDEDCTFQPAEPGHVRCLPPTLSAFQGSGLFADAACQVPAVTVAPATCGADVKYAVVTAFGGSCGAPIASELRKVQGRGPAIYVNTTSGCAVQTAAGSNQQSTVSLGDVVAWTDFVEATETVGAGDVLAERVYVATDGARAHAGFRDVKLGVECSFQIMADGVTRCAPEDQPGAALYGDGRLHAGDHGRRLPESERLPRAPEVQRETSGSSLPPDCAPVCVRSIR